MRWGRVSHLPTNGEESSLPKRRGPAAPSLAFGQDFPMRWGRVSSHSKEGSPLARASQAVVGANGLDFGALQQRVHPAESRVRMLSEATPAWFVAFDLLAEGEEDLRKRPLGERRARLEKLLKGVKRPIFLTPYTRDPKTAEGCF